MRANRRPGAICFVAVDLAHVIRNGGVGTYFWNAARFLAGRGWRVHVLYAPDAEEVPGGFARARDSLASAGVTLSALADDPPPAHLRAPTRWSNADLDRSERVADAVRRLHGRERFDLIEFAEWGALAFRCVQAKRCGLAFAGCKLVVKLHGSSHWQRAGNHQWLSRPEDMRMDYAERYAFDHADVQSAPCQYMLDYAAAAGWTVRPDARVIGNVYPDPRPAPDATAPVREVVFFGRVETRKGIELFADAVADLDPAVAVTLLGKDTPRTDGTSMIDSVRRRLPGREVTSITGLDAEGALRYLAEPGRLAVIPSRVDNLPYAVVECAAYGIPFLSSNVGGIPEIVPDPVARQHLLFPPTATGLRQRLTAYLAASPSDRAAWQAAARVDVGPYNDRIADAYLDLLADPAAAPARPTAPPKVTVAVPHYNLGRHLPATLAALAAQTYPNLEVIVVDDGSTEPATLAVLDAQERLYPQFRFIRQANAGCGAARNHALALAGGEYFLPVDADNLARPHMVETFVTAMTRRPGVAAFTCYQVAFESEEELAAGRHAWSFLPTGGPAALGCLENVYGDNNAMFRTADLRAVGGYATDRATAWEDWITFLKLARSGRTVDVVPECLFDYRVHPVSRTATMVRDDHDVYAMRQHLLRTAFAGPDADFAEALVAFSKAVNDWGFRYAALAHERDVAVDRAQYLQSRLDALAHRVAEMLDRQVRKLPGLRGGLKAVFSRRAG